MEKEVENEVKKIKLLELVKNKSNLERLKELPLKELSGNEVLSYRKVLSKPLVFITEFEEQRDKYITEVGVSNKDGGKEIPKGLPTIEANEWMRSLLETEVEVTWKPFSEEIFSKVINSLSTTFKEIEELESIFLVSLEEKEV